MSNDTLDKLVIFLAKRDGIDKLVKTFQYVSKLVHWHVEATQPDLAHRAKLWEVASGLSRKAFRSSRFLSGLNTLRRNPGPTQKFRTLAVLGNAGEMVYFFFDHFLWLSRIGVLEPKLAKKMSFISAFGESVGYTFFIIPDFIVMRDALRKEKMLVKGVSCGEGKEEDMRIRVAEIRADSYTVDGGGCKPGGFDYRAGRNRAEPFLLSCCDVGGSAVLFLHGLVGIEIGLLSTNLLRFNILGNSTLYSPDYLNSMLYPLFP